MITMLITGPALSFLSLGRTMVLFPLSSSQSLGSPEETCSLITTSFLADNRSTGKNFSNEAINERSCTPYTFGKQGSTRESFVN